MKRVLLVAGILILGMSVKAKADTIDFEDQPAGPTNFAAATPHTVVEDGGFVTFSGGTILTDETNSNDLTNVYATETGAGYTDPLHIAFAGPVDYFSVEIVNNIQGTYTAEDSWGNLSTGTYDLDAGGFLTIPNEPDIVSVDISTANPYDFAIDNLTVIPAPEPSSLLLLGTGLIGLLGLAKRKALAGLLGAN